MHQARYDFYGPIHRGLRLRLAETLILLGQTDPRDEVAVARAVKAVRDQLRFNADHLRHEDEHIHPPIGKAEDRTAGMLQIAHEHHRLSMKELLALCDRIAEAPRGEREWLVRALYLGFSAFMADDLIHMHNEETVVLPRLQHIFDDAELEAMEHAIVASLSPDETRDAFGAMIGGGSQLDRVRLFEALAKNAPPEAVEGFLRNIAQQVLDPAAFARLERELLDLGLIASARAA